jgi:hypothetical protein
MRWVANEAVQLLMPQAASPINTHNSGQKINGFQVIEK